MNSLVHGHAFSKEDVLSTHPTGDSHSGNLSSSSSSSSSTGATAAAAAAAMNNNDGNQTDASATDRGAPAQDSVAPEDVNTDDNQQFALYECITAFVLGGLCHLG